MNKKNSSIHFVINGGTIDSHYDGSKDKAASKYLKSLAPFLKALQLRGPLALETGICNYKAFFLS